MAQLQEITLRAKTIVSKYWRDRRVLLLMVLLAVLLVAVLHGRQPKSPVLADVQKGVNFSVYYPRQDKLPKGYVLDTRSFRTAQTGVVIYSVQTGKQRLIFSEEQSPGPNVIDKFTTSFIPLHNSFTTDNGKALMGSVGKGATLQTVVSLPVTNGPWVVITAPAATKQSDMQQILDALTK